MITLFTPPIRSANKPRVLIVDDNPRFSQSARLILQQSGHYVVCEENDAASALETARSFRPDLILIDLVMPQFDGAEVAAQIESDWALHGVPIVFVTGLVRLRRRETVNESTGAALYRKQSLVPIC
jgi:two-component system OmpR family response regulator